MQRMRRLAVPFLTIGLVIYCAGSGVQRRGAVLMRDEPLHRVRFENRYARIYDVAIPPRDASLYHTHANPIAGVVISDEPNWEQILGSQRGPVELPRAVGAVLDNWERALPYTHRVGNAGSSTIHYVIGEWLSSPGIVSEALPETKDMKLVKQGRVARFYRVLLGPGESSEAHTHTSPGLTVLVSSGTVKDEHSSVASILAEPGAWLWRDPNHRHVLHNTGATSVIVTEIDWR